MPEIILNGVPVRFPFEPYKVQEAYMLKVIECLQKGENGILESPTGTGKTLCLLCSTLGWLEIKKAEHRARLQNIVGENTPEFFNNLSSQLIAGAGQAWVNKNAPPKIIYSSRTHSQLTQAVSELKRTTYSHLKVAVLGSRDQMCVHPEVSKETNNNTKVHMCQVRVKARNCYFSNQVDAKKEDPDVRQAVLDIEDLVKIGKKKAFCPYYMARELKTDADIIFMPYNYLLDPKSRQAHGIELQGNIVIFDEAHNVEKTCEEAASLQIRSTDLALCIDEITQVMKKFQEVSDGSNIAANDPSQSLPDFSPEDLYTLKALFLELEKAVDAISLPADGTGSTFPGSFMFELLEKAEITPHKKTIILELLDKLIQYLTTTSASPFQRKGAGLQKFSDLIKIVFSKDKISFEHMNFVKQCYKVHVNIEEKKNTGGRQDGGWGAAKPNTLDSKVGRVISYWCFNPGFGMKDLFDQGAKCILLTSGTLAPMDSFVSELQVPFPIQLENPHIIEDRQIWVGTINKGPDGMDLNSSYSNRSDPKYIRSLGQTIVNFSRVIPDGLLVFFPSYPIMRSCRDAWQETGIWAQLLKEKPVYVEPQTKDEFRNAMEEFYKNINDPALKGACFMAVCRGKVSEGLDFADRNGRAVIVTGLPYPPMKDPRVLLKQEYLKGMRAKYQKGLNGWDWYKLEASRAVNQAIGRVIRHKDDYGAIILCDNRFGASNFKNQLSAWVRPHMKIYNGFGGAMRDLANFFKTAQMTLPQPKSKAGGLPAVSVSYEVPTIPAVSAEGFQAGPARPVISNATRRKLEKVLSAQSEYNNDWSSETYAKPIDATEGKAKLKSDGSIFSVLEQKTNVVDFNSLVASASNVTNYEAVKSGNKKKKIKLVSQSEKEVENLVNNSSGSTSSGEPNTAGPSKENSRANVTGVANYIGKVKQALGSEEYKAFSNAVKAYQKSKDYDAVAEVLKSLFVEDPSRHSLLRKFDVFVKKEQRPKFQQMCAEVLGSSQIESVPVQNTCSLFNSEKDKYS